MRKGVFMSARFVFVPCKSNYLIKMISLYFFPCPKRFGYRKRRRYFSLPRCFLLGALFSHSDGIPILRKGCCREYMTWSGFHFLNFQTSAVVAHLTTQKTTSCI